MRFFLQVCFFSWLILLPAFAASGKITGTIRDAQTNETLVGASIIVEGTSMGAAANIDGYYVILNVPPGTYKLKISMIGYSSVLIENVRVNIDQTTTIDAKLESKSIQSKEIVVVARTPIVQKDVAASRVTLDEKEISKLPVASVSAVVGLQAGIEPGLIIRGGSIDQTGFMVNGVMLRDGRNNTPFTGISYTSISEVQVQTGGFSAEYGNIRSGLVNIVTQDGSKNKYTFSMITEMSPANPKHFGISPNDPNSYWIRPYVDGPVAMYGTKAINPATGKPYWDAYTQLQYPQFAGWIAVANQLLKSSKDPSKILTPEAAQKLFLWQHRKDLNIVNPDYVVDASFGGPAPFVSDALGNLRFLASYRTTQTEYVVPLATPGVNDYTGQLKLTSDIGEGKKLMAQGLIAQITGTNNNNLGLPGYFTDPNSFVGTLNRPAGALDQVSYIDARMFTNDYWAPTTENISSFSGKYTQVLSPSTFYEVQASSFTSKYNTNPGRLRDTSSIYLFGNSYYVDEAPFGFFTNPSSSIDGMRESVGFSNSRDTSVVADYNIRADLQSQLDKYNEIKTGAEFHYTDNNVNSGSVDQYLPNGRFTSKWHTFPVRAALYAQDKLEFEGMIATLGVRLDYSNPNGDWYQFGAYPPAFAAAEPAINFDTVLTRIRITKQLDISPRLAISFPITDNSKLYFNYGHFRQMPIPDDLYLIRRFSDNNAVTRVANPNMPLPKTVAYELGYEQNIMDELLVRVAGYYKDNSFQQTTVNYLSSDSKINYNIVEPNNYSDTRGFELTLSKNRGDWIQGFVNYTYDVSTSGNFGFDTYYQNPATQRSYEAITQSYYQIKPIPQPYARANIDFFTPADFGPKLGGFNILGDWRFSFVGQWSSGPFFTWAGGGSNASISNNAQWNDYWNVDLRVTKSINLLGVDFQLFADLKNLLNYKYMSMGGFYDYNDFILYMKSLHLPASIGDPLGYGNIPGKDKPGDYRTGSYIPWDPNASQAQKDQWTKNKSYIDMPNLSYLTFLNPRQIFWGLRVTFAIND
ncbi:MAG: TonB-dependent receptor [Ignavibacteriaceae bacterium]